MTELAANVIAESMYASCDEEGNVFLLMNGMVDFRKNENALS